MLTVHTARARRFGSAWNRAGWGPWAAAEGRGRLAQGPSPCGVPWPPGRVEAGEGPGRGRGRGAALVCPVRAGSGDAGDNLQRSFPVHTAAVRRAGAHRARRLGKGPRSKCTWPPAAGLCCPPVCGQDLGVSGRVRSSYTPSPKTFGYLALFCPVSWWCPSSFTGNKLGLEGSPNVSLRNVWRHRVFIIRAWRGCAGLRGVRTSQPFVALHTRILGWLEVSWEVRWCSRV